MLGFWCSDLWISVEVQLFCCFRALLMRIKRAHSVPGRWANLTEGRTSILEGGDGDTVSLGPQGEVHFDISKWLRTRRFQMINLGRVGEFISSDTNTNITTAAISPVTMMSTNHATHVDSPVTLSSSRRRDERWRMGLTSPMVCTWTDATFRHTPSPTSIRRKSHLSRPFQEDDFRPPTHSPCSGNGWAGLSSFRHDIYGDALASWILNKGRWHNRSLLSRPLALCTTKSLSSAI